MVNEIDLSPRPVAIFTASWGEWVFYWVVASACVAFVVRPSMFFVAVFLYGFESEGLIADWSSRAQTVATATVFAMAYLMVTVPLALIGQNALWRHKNLARVLSTIPAAALLVEAFKILNL